MRFAPIFVAILILAAACDHRPVQKDLPVKNAPQNSVDHSGIHHSSIESSPAAATSSDELQFIDTLAALDEGTIDMAQLVQTRAAHPELKSMAADLVRDRQSEVATLREWRNQYFKNSSPSINAGLPGISTAVDHMDPDRLDPLKENVFDLAFVGEMVAQEEAAVEMAKYILTKPLGQPPELSDPLRSLSRSIIDSRSAEISRMKAWDQAWSKRP